MMMRLAAILLILSVPQLAEARETVYYLMKARSMGSDVPTGLNAELLTKIRRVISKHNRLVVEGEVDSMAVEGPVIPAKKLALQLEEARLAFEGLEFEKARNIASDVIAAIGSLPATPAGRGLWRQAQIRLIAVADGEGAEDEATRRIDELLRIEPSLDPSAMGVEPHLVDLLIAAKARLPGSVPVRLRIAPPGTKSWLDGQPVVTKPRTRPGHHRILVKRPGYAAYVGSFTAQEGLPVEVQVSLRRATHRHLNELDDALKELAPKETILEIAGKATREAGSTVGLLPSLGRQEDGRVQIRIAAVQPSGKLLGVGTLVTDGLLGSKDILLALKQASSGTMSKPLANGVYRAAEAQPPKRETGRSRERRLRQSRYRGDGLDLPVHPRLRARQSNSNLIAAGILLVVGGGVAAVLYHNYEPPPVSQTLPPTLGISVEIP
ncbi:MAG: hypothetical protein VX405_02865 [Myxococcota bacterium]|nr:hypothetical protein [Myxococcota bacterium]